MITFASLQRTLLRPEVVGAETRILADLDREEAAINAWQVQYRETLARLVYDAPQGLFRNEALRRGAVADAEWSIARFVEDALAQIELARLDAETDAINTVADARRDAREEPSHG